MNRLEVQGAIGEWLVPHASLVTAIGRSVLHPLDDLRKLHSFVVELRIQILKQAFK